MSVQPDFAEFLRRIRCGDPEAAQELVRRYESTIRLAVRTRLTDPALKRQLDSADICQSVLASFFVRAAAGQYDLADPGQLVALLVRMAQNKLVGHARFHRRQRRDARLVSGQDGAAEQVADGGPAPTRSLPPATCWRPCARFDAGGTRVGRPPQRRPGLGRDRGRPGRHGHGAANAAQARHRPPRPPAGPDGCR